jgi:50S ribosomal protein L16 3-hydroxylase
MRLLGGLTPARFLRDYWQKQPLLVRAAWPDWRDPLSPEELAGLACEAGVESRLVLAQAGDPWTVRHGPFQEADFLGLPDSHWTLLVQDVDKQAPDHYADLLEPFRFIPDWRIDDLMVSYATAQGSVGPHTDDYDVFLLQGLGRRRWQLSHQADPADTVPDSELRLLRRFTAEQEWVLEPGDLLYLPPRLAHYGVALEPCLTYSVGFRAPSHRELLSGFLDFLLEHIVPDLRYGDPDLEVQGNPGLISAAALTRIGQLVRLYLGDDPALLASGFGRFITEPKAAFAAQPEAEPLDLAGLLAHLDQGGTLERNPGSRFAYLEQDGATLLFIDGQEFLLGPDIAALAPLLGQYRVLNRHHLRRFLRQPAAGELLCDLVNEGLLVIYADD